MKTNTTIGSDRFIPFCKTWIAGLLGALALMVMPRAAQAIVVDGTFTDWTSSQLLGIDAAGDISGGDVVDWKNVWATFETNVFFVSYETQTNIDFAGNAWRYGVYLDIDAKPATGYRGPSGIFNMGAEFYIEGATVYQYAGDGTSWSWNSVGAASYAITGGRLEMSVTGSVIGVTSSSHVGVLLLGNNATTIDYARNDRAGFAYPRGSVVLDGTLSDWDAVPVIGTDAVGDVSGGDTVDWINLRALGENGTLNLSYQTAGNVDILGNGWRYDTYIDTDMDTNTGFTAVSGGSGAEYLIEGNTLLQYTGVGTNWSWSSIASLTYVVSTSRLEIAVAEKLLGLSGTYTVRCRLLGNNATTTDYAPAGAPGFAYTHTGTVEFNMDGAFGDWSGLGSLGQDATGDIGGGDIVDWDRVWSYSSTSTLFISYQTVGNVDFASNAFRYELFLDTDYNAATGYRNFDGSFKIGAEYMIEGGTLFQYTGDGTSWGWNSLGAVTYALSGRRLEMSVSRSSLGLSGTSAIRILFKGNNATTVDYASNDLTGYAVAPRGSVADALETAQVFWQPSTSSSLTGYNIYRQVHRLTGTPAITIDGSFGDWTGVLSGARAPYQPEDPTFISDVWVSHDATNLYLRMRTPSPLTDSRFGVYVYIDADANPSTGTRTQQPGTFGLKIGAEFRLRFDAKAVGGPKFYLDPFNPNFLPWARTNDSDAWLVTTNPISASQYAIGNDSYGGPTLTNNSFEVRLPLSSLNYSQAAGLVGMDFYFDYDGQDFFPTIEYAPGAPVKFEYGYHRVSAAAQTGASFKDTTVGGVTYDYAVSAVLAGGSEQLLDTSSLYVPAAHPLNFNAYISSTNALQLSWQNPDDSRVTAVRVVRNATRYPVDANDGTVVYESTGTNYTDTGLTAGTPYYYGSFGHDVSGQYTRRNWDSYDRSIPANIQGPISNLPTNGDYLVYFGSWDTARVKLAEKYDVVILHPGGGAALITPAQVRDIQDGVDNATNTADDVKVIAYISIGEDYGISNPNSAINQPRTNLPAQFDDHTGPCYYDCDTGDIIYENHGFPSFYVDEYDVYYNNMWGQTDGYPDQNQEWGSLYVNAGDPKWQEYEKQATYATDGFAGFDYIMNTLKVDGVFLDTVGVSTPWTYWNTLFGDYYWVRDGAIDYMAKLGVWYPGKIILPNRPMHLCFRDFAGKRFDDFRTVANGIFWESYSADIKYWWPGRNGTLFESAVQDAQNNADGRGFTTLCLDYYKVAIEGQEGGHDQNAPWYTTASDVVARAQSSAFVTHLSPSRSLAEMSDDAFLINHPTNYAGKADLFPLSVFATKVGTNQAQVEIRICNQGPATTGITFKVTAKQNNTLLADQTITNMSKWQVFTYFRTITLSNIGNNIHVEVDVDHTVNEFDENNNYRDTYIDPLLNPPPPGTLNYEHPLSPDVKVAEIQILPNIPIVGSNFTIRVNYTNSGVGVATSTRMYLWMGTSEGGSQIANFETPYILPGEMKLVDFQHSVTQRTTYFASFTVDAVLKINERSGTNYSGEANNLHVTNLVTVSSYTPVSDWANDTNAMGPMADVLGDGTASLAAGDIVNSWISEDSDELLFRMELATNVALGSLDYLLFLDTDSSSGTGYLVTDMGADYMINDGVLYKWTNSVNQSDWSNWGVVAAADQPVFVVESDQRYIDMAVRNSVLGLGSPATPVKVFFYVSDSNSGTADDSYPGYGGSVQWPPIGGLIRIDGKLSDWTGVAVLATDGTNDGYDSTNVPQPGLLGGFADLQTTWAAYDTNYLYLKVSALSNLNFNSAHYGIFLDMDRSTNTGYIMSWNANGATVGADYRFDNGVLFKFTGTNQADWAGWSQTNNSTWYQTGSTNGNQMEIAFKRSAIGWVTTNSLGFFLLGTDAKNPAGFEDDITDYMPELGQGASIYPTMPDLTVLSITSAPLNIYTGTAATITVSVKNIGSATTGSFTTRLTAAGATIADQVVASLASGSTTNLNFSWTPSATGNIAVAGTADLGANVVESSEANNSLTITQVVKSTVGGTIKIDGLLTDWTNSAIIVLGNDGTNDGFNASGFPVTNQLGGLADLQSTRAIYDATYLYMRLDMRSNIDLTAGGYSVYLDTDRSTASGYLTSFGSVGADYRFFNGTLYKFTGTNQNDFGGFVATNDSTWFAIANTNQAKMEIAFKRTAIGWTTTNSMGVFFIGTDNKTDPSYTDDISDYMPELGLGGTVYPPLADLTILSITSAPLNIVSGRLATVTVKVQNIGGLNAGAFTTRLTAASTVITNRRVSSLSAGAITNLVINWTPALTGDVSLVGFADSWSNISEAAENNNTLTTNQFVKPLIGGPTYFIDGIMTDWTNSAVHFLGADGTNDGYNFNGFPVTNQLSGFADILNTWAVQDTNYLYVRMDFRSNINQSVAGYAIYVDTDRSTNTGYLANWGTVGADYRYFNGDLYRFAGTNQADFTWTMTNNAAYYAVANTNQAKMEIAMKRTALNWTTTNAIGFWFTGTDNKGAGFEDDITDYQKELGQGILTHP